MMQDTRQQIMKILKAYGQATVEEMSSELQLTSATVRHHLDILRGDGLVEAPEIRRRTAPGRPQYVYSLTQAAADHFPQNYAGLADLMLSELRERLDPAAREAILQGVVAHLASEFPPGRPDEDFGARLRRVVDFLNTKGYMIHHDKDDAGYRLRVTNCPYRDIVQNRAQVCKLDMSLFSMLMGVSPRQASRIADGDMMCTYYFSVENLI